MRTGSEPVTARSPLRLRFWLGLWGLVWTALGTSLFALAERTGWAVTCGVLFLIVATDLVLVIRHIRQGPHYQPGRNIPPYEPDHGPGPSDGPGEGPGRGGPGPKGHDDRPRHRVPDKGWDGGGRGDGPGRGTHRP
ncbi:DUF6343 family protein [Streptomyces sp. NPDC002018]|uniref:DUF6343 family protein n=1 Tax=Streptomyces sp. NPDC002018 TaxID=3364629 RepID=UPI0036BE4B0B